MSRPEHPNIPPADQFPHVAEPYTQGYAPISISRGRRLEINFFKIIREIGAIGIALAVLFGLAYLVVQVVAWLARLIFGGAM